MSKWRDAKLSQRSKKGEAPKLVLAPAPESDVQGGVMEVLDAHPGVDFYWRVNSGAKRGNGGRMIPFYHLFGFEVDEDGKPRGTLPDLMGLLMTGHLFALECKREGGFKETLKKRRENQEAVISRIAQRGCAGFVRSPDEANDLITRFLRSKGWYERESCPQFERGSKESIYVAT